MEASARGDFDQSLMPIGKTGDHSFWLAASPTRSAFHRFGQSLVATLASLFSDHPVARALGSRFPRFQRRPSIETTDVLERPSPKPACRAMMRRHVA